MSLRISILLNILSFLFATSVMADTCGITVAELQAKSTSAKFQGIYGPNIGNLVQGEFSGGATTFIVYQHDDDDGKNTLFLSAKVPKKNCVSTYAIGFCLNKPENDLGTQKIQSTMKIFAQGYKSFAYAKL